MRKTSSLMRMAVGASVLLASGSVALGQANDRQATDVEAADVEATDVEAAESSRADIDFFEQHVRPVLEAKCWRCHGPTKSRGDLRLDHRTFVLQGGELGPAVMEDDPADSVLLRAINYEDLEMPPDGRLADEQIAILTDWVMRGLPWTPGDAPSRTVSPPDDERTDDERTDDERTDDERTDDERTDDERTDDERTGDETDTKTAHWAYQPVTVPTVPIVGDTRWADNPIDRFILAGLEQHQLRPNPPASPQTLARRLYFDLLGLPPRLEQVKAFAANPSPLAYEQLVEQLLGHPQFGVKWGRHWLDLVRFAETNGYERDGHKANAWRYRDYVISAFNSDKPYDRFVKEQLAGDELRHSNESSADESSVDESSLIATGYYRMGLWDDEPADADQAYYDHLDDVVSTTGMVFLGTTLGCARCHDHKIDPIPQRDYYRMLAFFHNIYKNIHQSQFKRSAFTLNTQTVIASADQRAAQEQQQDRQRETIDELQRQVDATEQRVFATFSNPEKEDAQDDDVRRHLIQKRVSKVLSAVELRQYRTAGKQLRQLQQRRLPPLATALTIRENGRLAPDTFVLVRGSAHAPGERVEPGFPSAMTNLTPSIPDLPKDVESSGRRLALANWIVDSQNPLAARVIVNRIWQHHLGRGLVRTTSDFGRYGDRPTHPKLLDYLATELIRHDWQLKWLHRLILTSQTYRISSTDQSQNLIADPENDRFWRFDMRRLTAEELRDTVLSVTGQLNLEMGGPSVYPKIPAEVLQSASRPDAAWGHSSPADQARRSVYVFVKRSMSVPVLQAFDSADKDGSCPVRFATTVPTQALTTLNGEFFNRQADILATKLRHDVGDDPREQVSRALSLTLSRNPEPDQIQRGVELLERWQNEDHVSAEEALQYFCLLALNLNEMIYID